MKTAFITGSTGFLGLNLKEELSKLDWKVIAFHLPGVDLKYLSRFDVVKVKGDLNSYDSLVEAIPMKLMQYSIKKKQAKY